MTVNQYNEMRNTVLIVSNAGLQIVNGEYRHVEVPEVAGYFERIVSVAARNGDKKPVLHRYTIYRCFLGTEKKVAVWYISRTAPGDVPGSTNDINHYRQTAFDTQIAPDPSNKWDLVEGNTDGHPPPQVKSRQLSARDMVTNVLVKVGK